MPDTEMPDSRFIDATKPPRGANTAAGEPQTSRQKAQKRSLTPLAFFLAVSGGLGLTSCCVNVENVGDLDSVNCSMGNDIRRETIIEPSSKTEKDVSSAVDQLVVGLRTNRLSDGYHDAVEFLGKSLYQAEALCCIARHFEDTRWTRTSRDLDPDETPEGFEPIGTYLENMVMGEIIRLDAIKESGSWDKSVNISLYDREYFETTTKLLAWMEKHQYSMKKMQSAYDNE